VASALGYKKVVCSAESGHELQAVKKKLDWKKIHRENKLPLPDPPKGKNFYFKCQLLQFLIKIITM